MVLKFTYSAAADLGLTVKQTTLSKEHECVGKDEFGGVLQLMFILQYTNLEKQRGRRMGKQKREGEWVLGLFQNQGPFHLLSKPSLRNLCVSIVLDTSGRGNTKGGNGNVLALNVPSVGMQC